MEQPPYVFVVDGGGTKTATELRARDGRSLARFQAGPCNLHHDASEGLAAVMTAWRQCCAASGLDPADAAASTVISAAIAGASAPAGRACFDDWSRAFARAYLCGDDYAALLGAFEGGPGVLLVIGTGTACCRLDPAGRFERRGGWGFPAGDRGGGAWIGLHSVTAWLDHRDGVGAGADEPLWRHLDDYLGNGRPAILAWLRRATPADFAALAPAVLDAAGRGSPCAATILDEAAGHLARLVRALRPGPGLEVALTGGLAPTLAPRLAAVLGHGFAPRPADPLHGAWLVGIGRLPPEFAVAREPA